jgi:hypothetical protein
MSRGTWIQRGFDDFSDGTFGNAGQNLYVSRAGVLQRIHHFDINRDGYVDLLFVNSQDNNERPPAFVYSDVLGTPKLTELPCDGARAAAVGDLNGNGYDDLVIGMDENGIHRDLNAYVYFGSPQGLSERYKLELPVPSCEAVAIGDFNGDGLPDIAFSTYGKLRVFYQTKTGFLPGQFTDYKIEVTAMVAADLDGDGCADLYVKNAMSAMVYWGGENGISPKSKTSVWKRSARKSDPGRTEQLPAGVLGALSREWMPRIISLNGKRHLFFTVKDESRFVPVIRGRTLGKPVVLKTGLVRSVAIADINADGHPDIVFAGERSWVYWGSENGFSNTRRTALPTQNARDVAVGDLDGDGLCEIVICQERNEESCDNESLVFQCGRGLRVPTGPVRLQTHDAQAVFIARTCDSEKPQVIFINNITGRVRGDISSYLYWGGPDGYKPERRTEFPGWAATDALCCDFNDDGRVDILFANCAENSPGFDPGCFLFWQGKDGFNPKHWDVMPSKHAIGIACADLNRDGYLDVVVVGYFNDEVWIYYGGPKGFDVRNRKRIRLAKDGIVCDDARRPFIADFNNDGWLDIVIPQASTHTVILWGGPDGFSIERSTFLNATCTAAANAADLDGDGWLELILGGNIGPRAGHKYETSLYIYWGGPEGFREDRRQQLPAWKTNKISIADFNNDGVLDIFANAYHMGRTRDLDASVYWGKPGGVYEAATRSRLFNHSSCGSIAADLNEDGWIDLAVANHKWHGNHAGHSIIWWNGPDGFNESKQTWLPTKGPHGMVVVDPGNVMDRGPEEFYISSPHELPAGAKVTGIEWDADLPPKTWVRAWLRFAETKETLSKAAWLQPGQSSTGRWVQYRLALGASNSGSSPRVREVRVNFDSRKDAKTPS